MKHFFFFLLILGLILFLALHWDRSKEVVLRVKENVDTDRIENGVKNGKEQGKRWLKERICEL